ASGPRWAALARYARAGHGECAGGAAAGGGLVRRVDRRAGGLPVLRECAWRGGGECVHRGSGVYVRGDGDRYGAGFGRAGGGGAVGGADDWAAAKWTACS